MTTASETPNPAGLPRDREALTRELAQWQSTLSDRFALIQSGDFSQDADPSPSLPSSLTPSQNHDQSAASITSTLQDDVFELWTQFQTLDQRFQVWLRDNLSLLQEMSPTDASIRSSLTQLNHLYSAVKSLCERHRNHCHQDRQASRKQASGVNAYQKMQVMGQRQR